MKIKRKKGRPVFPLYLFSEIASSQFCPRCLWLQIKFGIPFYPPPTEFELELRRFARKYVKEFYKETQKIFNWIIPEEISKVRNKIDRFEREAKLSPAKFHAEVGETSLLLEGAPDNIIFLKDGSNLLISYRFLHHPEPNELKDEMSKLSLYLNAVGYISEKVGYKPKYLSGVFIFLPKDMPGWDIMKFLDPEDREIEIYNLVLNWDIPDKIKVRKGSKPEKRSVSKNRRQKKRRRKQNRLFFIAEEDFFHFIFKPLALWVRYSPSDVEKKAKQFEKIVSSSNEPAERCPRCSHIKI